MKPIRMLIPGVAVTLGAMSLDAMAACTMTPTGGSPSSAPLVLHLPAFDSGAFDPTVPNGQVLATRKVSLAAVGGKMHCPGGIGQMSYRGTTGAAGGAFSTYPTSIAGVGIRFKFTPPTSILGYWPRSYNYGGAVNTSVSTGVSVVVDLVKTGPITAGGSITGEVAGWFAQNDTSQLTSIVVDGAIIVQPKVPTCTVSTPSVQVPMGAISTRTFTGLGSSSGAQAFNIGLQCSGGDPNTSTNAYVTLTDATNPTNTSQVLSLTPTSQASGVGVQILNGTTVLGYGPDSAAPGNTNQWYAGNIAVGTSRFTIPLSARYVQTGATVTPGTANAQATFTMSYQ
ncbi:fimbrial protein [Ralstonia sp. R-29]|uniref:fimbrial protein n=1 Tax=Ralstonia sp. R-29 TaxID=3404059 RepID=UPI003CF287B3